MGLLKSSRGFDPTNGGLVSTRVGAIQKKQSLMEFGEHLWFNSLGAQNTSLPISSLTSLRYRGIYVVKSSIALNILPSKSWASDCLPVALTIQAHPVWLCGRPMYEE
ncbi:hypothetical protein ACFE04_004651 [Oxalis oulophora]